MTTKKHKGMHMHAYICISRVPAIYIKNIPADFRRRILEKASPHPHPISILLMSILKY